MEMFSNVFVSNNFCSDKIHIKKVSKLFLSGRCIRNSLRRHQQNTTESLVFSTVKCRKKIMRAQVKIDQLSEILAFLIKICLNTIIYGNIFFKKESLPVNVMWGSLWILPSKLKQSGSFIRRGEGHRRACAGEWIGARRSTANRILENWVIRLGR